MSLTYYIPGGITSVDQGEIITSVSNGMKNSWYYCVICLCSLLSQKDISYEALMTGIYKMVFTMSVPIAGRF